MKNQTNVRMQYTALSPTAKEEAYNIFSTDTTKQQLSESP